MGQKIDPRGFRLVVTKDWSSRWYANNQSFSSNLIEDVKIREFIMKKFGRRAAVGRVVIERPLNWVCADMSRVSVSEYGNVVNMRCGQTEASIVR